MRAEDLQEAIHAQPFRPFAIVGADGKHISVRHPEWITHRGRTAAVIDQDERLHIIDVMLVQRLEVGRRCRPARHRQSPTAGNERRNASPMIQQGPPHPLQRAWACNGCRY